MLLFLKAWEGVGVVSLARKLIGSTDPLQADPSTIRRDLVVQTGRLGPLIYCVSLVCVI
jgi:nucleoside diphosphate kinase